MLQTLPYVLGIEMLEDTWKQWANNQNAVTPEKSST